jgi:sortase A
MKKKNFLRIFALVSGISGVMLLAFVLLPIMAYEIKSSQFDSFLSPTVSNFDYTKPSNWFVGNLTADQFTSSKVVYYTLSIPKLNIRDARVSIGGENLSQSLIQYPGTAVPGKRGNAVIFGHSVLPQFYNPNNYLTIFSTLPSVKKGDDIYVEYDGIFYQYKVEVVYETRPEDIQVLEQNNSDSFLTLITCVPPGHPLRPKRFIVKARIVPLEERNEVIRN